MQKERLFARIGEMTVQFTTLEHQLQGLLETLLGENSRLIGPFFIHELNLAVLLRKIKHVARRLQAMSNDINFIIRKVSNPPGSVTARPQEMA
jgi:hypothetical protein